MNKINAIIIEDEIPATFHDYPFAPSVDTNHRAGQCG